MCTASWRHLPDEYELWFNRDEDIHRPEAFYPMLHECKKARWICPVDPVGEGTWIFGNNHGLSGCLLNDYSASTRDLPPPEESRGRLLMSLCQAGNIGEFEKLMIGELNNCVFAPFIILALAPARAVNAWSWDGKDLHVLGEQMPLAMITSSSWNFEQVSQVRRGCFDDLVKPGADSSDLANFHLSRARAGPAYSVLMTRDLSRTVSITRILCRQGQLQMTYERRNQDGQLEEPQFSEIPLLN